MVFEEAISCVSRSMFIFSYARAASPSPDAAVVDESLGGEINGKEK